MQKYRVLLAGLCIFISAQAQSSNPRLQHKVNNCIITVLEGDITQQSVDAIVNAANSELQHGSGVAGAIRAAAGGSADALQNFCDSKKLRCPVGKAITTPAFNLEKQGIHYIIHAVGPHGSDQGREMLIDSAYTSALQEAVRHNVHSIAFPVISCGIFGYPLAEGVEKAIQAVHIFLSTQQHALQEVRFIIKEDRINSMSNLDAAFHAAFAKVFSQEIPKPTQNKQHHGFQQKNQKEGCSEARTNKLKFWIKAATLPTIIVGCAVCYLLFKLNKKK